MRGTGSSDHSETDRATADDAPSTSDPSGVLVDAVQRLSLARTLGEVQDIVRTAARALCGADGATFVLRDGGMCLYADEDAISPLWKGQRFPVDVCVSGWAMRNGEPALIEDIYVDPRVPHEAYRPTFVKSLAMVPIRRRDPIGAIGNYWSEHHRPTPYEVELLQALADATAVAMENVAVWSEMEERVAQRTADLNAALAFSEHTLRTVTHELRNAIGGSRGLLEAILADPNVDLDDDTRADLQLVHQGTADGLEIVEHQLAQAKAQAREFAPRAAEVDVAGLIVDLERTYRALRHDDVVKFVVDAVPDGLELTTDRHLLAQILRNLISNGLKFTDDGEVRLSVREGPGEHHLTFTVADTGVGIAEEDQPRVFEEFEQVDDAQDGRSVGAGLGLPFVQRVTTLLGGELELTSSPGLGSTFRVILPRR